MLLGSKAPLPFGAVVENPSMAGSEGIDPSGVWVIDICWSQIRHCRLFVALQA
jgi:hypothetical protein